jgi:hypothetical protein
MRRPLDQIGLANRFSPQSPSVGIAEADRAGIVAPNLLLMSKGAS